MPDRQEQERWTIFNTGPAIGPLNAMVSGPEIRTSDRPVEVMTYPAALARAAEDPELIERVEEVLYAEGLYELHLDRVEYVQALARDALAALKEAKG